MTSDTPVFWHIPNVLRSVWEISLVAPIDLLHGGDRLNFAHYASGASAQSQTLRESILR